MHLDPGIQPGLEAPVQVCVHLLVGLKETPTKTTTQLLAYQFKVKVTYKRSIENSTLIQQNLNTKCIIGYTCLTDFPP
uniref:Uncharacterized protein n=1 Tax=Monopterus albus TaxID=43700 RepID=A0A3Q3JKB0_MONAL